MKTAIDTPMKFGFRESSQVVVGLCSDRHACALLAAGCGGAKKPSASGKKRVVTSFTIIADMAREVAGDAAEVESITKPGAEIHGYEPTPKDIVKAQQADLVLWNGMNLERWFEKFFTQRARTSRARC